MKKSILFAALCCIAMFFVACEKDKTNETISGSIAGHNYVDLGLPSGTQWATCNMGATKPEEYGNYYAWGEITTKTTYSESNYTTTTTKYHNDLIPETADMYVLPLTTLESADDAARQNWCWRWGIPTFDEWTELIDNCTWTWTTRNGVNGFEIKAKNGNFIFLPAAGWYYDDELKSVNSCGNYWSSSTYDYGTSYASLLRFGDSVYYMETGYRHYGQSIRPVVKF